MREKISIYDTSLRDGLQGEKIKLNLADKLSAVDVLDKLGIHYIEGGFPLASENEQKFFERVKHKQLKNAKISAFGSTARPGGDATSDPHLLALLHAETEVVTVVGKSWTAHVEEVIRTTQEANIKTIIDSVSFLKKEGRTVIYDAEHFFDGYANHPEYALATITAACEAGASIVVLCDTNGGTTHHPMVKALRAVKAIPNMKFGIHLHDDTGCAIASSMIALDEGAVQVQGTMNGWGERCGNANLTVLIPNLVLKTEHKVVPKENLKHLTYVSRYLDELANVSSHFKQPYTGRCAFAHKAGQHADVILKNPQLMEHIDGDLVGNSRRVLLSELAGKATVAYKMARFGNFNKNSVEVHELTEVLKEKEQEGFEYEAAEASFDLLIRRQLGQYKPLFKLLDYGVNIENEVVQGGDSESLIENDSHIKAYVRLLVDDEEFSGIANGIGPVAALDAALRKALVAKFPFINFVKLSDYKVRVLNGDKASEAKVQVHVSSMASNPNWVTKSWSTVGVSANIIHASWMCLVDSLEYVYNEQRD